MKHYGDITKLNGAELEPVDLIVGGSPCQDLSVAGRREGLAGERSGLFMEMIRIVKEMRNATNFIRPRFLLWENVCGAFSSGKPKGADFQAVLAEIVRITEPEAPDVPIPQKGWSKAGVLMGDEWSIAWRTHDAQYWGVPQRRRRISLVADFRGQSAPEILFERTSLPGNSEQSGTEREGAAGTAENSIGETGKCLNPWDGQSKHIQPEDGIAEALYSGERSYGGGRSYVLRSQMKHHEPIVMNPRPMSMVTQTDKAATLGAQDYKDPQIVTYGVTAKGNGDAFINEETHTSLSSGGGCPGQGYPCVLSFQERSGKPGGEKGILIQEDHVGALSTLNNQAVCYGIDQQGGKGGANYTCDVAPALASDSHGTPHAVCYSIDSYTSNAMLSSNPNSGISETDKAKTIDLNGGNPACNQGGVMIVNDQPTTTAFAVNQRDEVRDVNGKAVALQAEPGMKQQTFVFDSQVYHGCKEFDDGISQTVNAQYGTGGNNQPLVVAVGNGQLNNMAMSEKANALDTMHDQQCVMTNVIGALCADDHKGINNQYVEDDKCQITNNTVRRLTPLECERLQGYPDGWTDIPEASDSKRYKALGNSIALPFWEHLAKRFAAIGEVKSIGSLFDGIGGFPLVFLRAGAKTLWTSEIEPFCQKVVEYHFDEDGNLRERNNDER